MMPEHWESVCHERECYLESGTVSMVRMLSRESGVNLRTVY